MTQITYHTTLYYYDGPQVIEGRDYIGGNYVAVLIEPNDHRNRYLVCGVQPHSLQLFREGRMDLRALLEESSKSIWFTTYDETGLTEPLILIPGEGFVPEEFLPDGGFFLSSSIEQESRILNEATIQRNLYLELSVNPPESYDHRIHANTLGSLLHHFQVLVKYSYSSAKRDLTLKARRSLDTDDAHVLDVVVPAMAGSFKIGLSSSKTPNLIGQTELSRAMEKLDQLFLNAEDPKKTLNVLKEHKGHLAGSFIRFLEFLKAHNSGLEYIWAEPSSSELSVRKITENQISPLLDELASISNLSSENVTIVGALREASETNGRWCIENADGKFKGKSRKDGKLLRGLRIGTIYKFECIEEIEEIAATGKEVRRLYLESHEPI